MKKVVITKNLKPRATITMYFDSKVFDLFFPRPSPENAQKLIKLISQTFAHGLTETTTVYFSRIIKNKEIGQFKLFCTYPADEIFSPTTMMLKNVDPDANIPIDELSDIQNGQSLPINSKKYKKITTNIKPPNSTGFKRKPLTLPQQQMHPCFHPPPERPVAPIYISRDKLPPEL